MPPPRVHLALTEPAPWITRFAALIRPGGTVLDVACGGGRHARWLLDRGFHLTLVDRDTTAVADLADRADVIAADLEDGTPWPLAGRRFDAVVVTNYLFRPLLSRLVESVAPGGVLLYQTFAVGNERWSRPRDPDHLLRPGELLTAVAGRLQVVAFEQGIVQRPGRDRPAVVQSLCAAATDQPLAVPPSLPAAAPASVGGAPVTGSPN
ncbi:class I SAM-dependent methyltransferase [Roseospira visakhapatnamensis]|uniref:SAM-dependent methyltransferase n=1 Tax=Roseospira visakhapatnamensis TaxID=390880 RepID=A0A7W6WBI8_9PROT|nr:class I SAM-dependent methyltransferase [Roseospira visakhapatnamensis]MBB4267888.1 SAM-dependent methyltransferase [Roseospira visakhapatnamensis]